MFQQGRTENRSTSSDKFFVPLHEIPACCDLPEELPEVLLDLADCIEKIL
jgi:hypothetical protein